MSLRRLLVLRWPLIMAAVFSAFTLILLASLYFAQSRLRSATDSRLVADSQRRAASVTDFLAERRRAVVELAGSHEIDSYLVNRALGMSPQYGLNVSLDAIEQRFQQQIEQNALRGQAVYTGIVFLGEDGTILAEAGRNGPGASLPTLSGYSPQLLLEPGTWSMVASSPITHKGVFSGRVVTISDLRLLSRLLIASGAMSDTPGKYQEFLLTDEGVSIPAPEQATNLAANVGRAFAGLPENQPVAVGDLVGAEQFRNFLALRTSIAGSSLSMLTLMPEEDAYGQMASPAYVLLLGAFSAALLLAAVGFVRMQKRAIQLQDDYAESDRHGAELEVRNQILAAEISRRQAVEAALNEKTAALDKANADLHASRERMDLALQGANDGLWDWNLETDEVYYSPRWKSMLGYAEDDLASTPATLARLIDPEQKERVLQQVSDYLEGRLPSFEIEFRMHHKAGHWVHILSRAMLARDAEGRPLVPDRLVGTHVDITARKAAEDKIRELAFYDPLTHLPNRRLLMVRIEQAMAAASRHQRQGVLLFVDLDDFKTINDTLGHDMGDLLLKQVAQRLIQSVRDSDTVARLGGDEFVVMLEDLSDHVPEAATKARIVGEKILATLNQIYQLGHDPYHSMASVGVTLFGDVESIDEPLKRADLAMYEAKAAGGNTLRFFDPQMQVLRRAVIQTVWSKLFEAETEAKSHAGGGGR